VYIDVYTNFLTTRCTTRSDYLGDIKALSMMLGEFIGLLARVFHYNKFDRLTSLI